MPPPLGVSGPRTSRPRPSSACTRPRGVLPGPRPARRPSPPRLATWATALHPARRLLDPRTPRTRLPPSGVAAAATAAYILPAGLAASLWPVPVFRLLFPAPTPLPPTPWLSLIGLLAAAFGLYYAGAALGEATPGVGAGTGFKVATAAGRLLLGAALAGLGAATGGSTGRGFAALGALNAVGGLAMAAALGREA